MTNRPVSSRAPRARSRLKAVWAFSAVAALGVVVFALTPGPVSEAEITLTPPAYTGQPPLVLGRSTGPKPTTARFVSVPEGTQLNVRLLGEDRRPSSGRLFVDGAERTLTPVGQRDAEASLTLDTQAAETLHTLQIEAQGRDLGRWTITVKQDARPTIALTAPPSISSARALRLAFEAEAPYPIVEIRAELSPTSPNAKNTKAVRVLTDPKARAVRQTLYDDFSDLPLAGKPVLLRLIAKDAAGHEGESPAFALTLPDRRFNNALARALLNERSRLLQNPDVPTRDAIANILASLARQQMMTTHDPVLTLTLRAAAVRLILTPGAETEQAVATLIGQIATRIEDGATGVAFAKVRDVNRALGAAFNRADNDAEIDQLLAHAHETLTVYLDALTAQAIPDPTALGSYKPLFEAQKTQVSAEDLHRQLTTIRIALQRDKRAAARDEWQAWQEEVENVRLAPRAVSPEQKVAMEAMTTFRTLARDQTKLRDQTLAKSPSHKSESVRKLAQRQRDLLKRLRSLVASLPRHALFSALGAETAITAMQQAAEALDRGAETDAAQRQSAATIALNNTAEALIDRLQTAVAAAPER
jgi:hypothetical protein